METKEFETLSLKETCEALQTDAVNGLSAEEAAARLQKYGKNKLEEKKKMSPIAIFFSQLKDPMIYVTRPSIGSKRATPLTSSPWEIGPTW